MPAAFPRAPRSPAEPQTPLQDDQPSLPLSSSPLAEAQQIPALTPQTSSVPTPSCHPPRGSRTSKTPLLPPPRSSTATHPPGCSRGAAPRPPLAPASRRLLLRAVLAVLAVLAAPGSPQH